MELRRNCLIRYVVIASKKKTKQNKKPPKGLKRCCRTFFHGPLVPLKIRLNQASLNDLTMHSRSIILKPPSSYSFITDTLFTLSVPFHKNLNNNLLSGFISSLGVGSTKQTYTNLGIRKDLIIQVKL